MRHLVFRIFFISIIGLFLIIYVFPWNKYNIEMPFTGGEYKLGLDLQGGIELDYKIDLSEAKLAEDYNSEKETQIVEGLKSIVDKRIETLNINDSEINDASYGGENHIIVQIPLKGNDAFENTENIQRAKEAIGKVVKIVFKERRYEVSQEDLDYRKSLAETVYDEIQSGELFSVVSDKAQLSYENIETGSIIKLKENFEDIEYLDGINETKTLDGEEGYLIIDDIESTDKNYIFVSKEPSAWKNATNENGDILNDMYFVKSTVAYNEVGTPMVELVFNDEGAKIFGEISERLIGQQMAIFVGGEMLTAPVINEAIYGGTAVITGDYSSAEANELSQNINTGVVPAPIYLTSEKTIDSKIGTSSLEKLITSGTVGFLIIFMFLIVVYRFAGVMASIALFLYIVLILAIVKLLGTTLTLASIAGLILSIGMAIDANILIFERIKDELKKGETILDATDIGFKKSWTAIWDSNFTGLIVALILFIFGINLIKGFGLMLAVGIIVSLFTVMWISKVLLLYISLKIKSKQSFIGYKD